MCNVCAPGCAARSEGGACASVPFCLTQRENFSSFRVSRVSLQRKYKSESEKKSQLIRFLKKHIEFMRSITPRRGKTPPAATDAAAAPEVGTDARVSHMRTQTDAAEVIANAQAQTVTVTSGPEKTGASLAPATAEKSGMRKDGFMVKLRKKLSRDGRKQPSCPDVGGKSKPEPSPVEVSAFTPTTQASESQPPESNAPERQTDPEVPPVSSACAWTQIDDAGVTAHRPSEESAAKAPNGSHASSAAASRDATSPGAASATDVSTCCCLKALATATSRNLRSVSPDIGQSQGTGHASGHCGQSACSAGSSLTYASLHSVGTGKCQEGPCRFQAPQGDLA